MNPFGLIIDKLKDENERLRAQVERQSHLLRSAKSKRRALRYARGRAGKNEAAMAEELNQLREVLAEVRRTNPSAVEAAERTDNQRDVK